MKTLKLLFIHCILLVSVLAAVPATAREAGVSYGREFRGNTDLEQYELFYHEPLPFMREYESGLRVMSDVEVEAALIREAGGDSDDGGRFSVIPRIIFCPHPNINLFVGVGAGFMVGNTEFTDHDLGGEFLLNTKAGIQFLLGHHWSIGYFFYHQSNAGVYDHNQGLTMNDLLLSYSF